MKTSIIIVIFIAALLILWRLSLTKTPLVEIKESNLILKNGDCRVTLPISRHEEELMDVLDITRIESKLPNGAKLYYESIDFPLKYDFSLPVDALVAKIFNLSKTEIYSQNGNILFLRGKDIEEREFDILVLTQSSHRLQLLYPLDDASAKTLAKCLIKGKSADFPKTSYFDLSIKPEWSQKSIIIDNLIEKDM